MNDVIEKIPLDRIQPHPANRHVGGFDKAKLDQLAESIKAVGVQQPAIVRLLNNLGKNGEHMYELVAGERRWRASKIAGMDYLPCIVRELDDAATLKIQIIENLQREDVHPLDEADGYARLIKEGGYEVELVAQELGKSPSYVYQRLKLLDLIKPVQDLLVSGKITAGHGIHIARLGEDQQKEVLEELSTYADYRGEEMPSVRSLADWIQENIMLELSRASWKLDDAKLLPEAGSCKACPKRTLFQPALFADVCKKDHCTDRACFEAKGQALVQKKREELKKEEHLEVIDGYVCYGKEKPQGALDNYDWTECKKKDPGAVRVLVVAGNQPGRMTYGIKNERSGSSSSYQRSETEIAEEKARKLRGKARDETRKQIFEEIIDQVELEIGGEGKFALETLRQVASWGWSRVWDDGRAAIVKWMGWGKPEKTHGWEKQGQARILQMDEAALLRFLMVCSLSSGLTKASQWSAESVPTDLAKVGGFYGIAADEILAAKYEKYGVKPEEPSSSEDPDDEDEALEEGEDEEA
jgi:ParB/RepB/Spo0J family partition protein